MTFTCTDVDILNGRPCLTHPSIPRLTQELGGVVSIGQFVGYGTGPRVLTSYQRGL